MKSEASVITNTGMTWNGVNIPNDLSRLTKKAKIRQIFSQLHG